MDVMMTEEREHSPTLAKQWRSLLLGVCSLLSLSLPSLGFLYAVVLPLNPQLGDATLISHLSPRPLTTRSRYSNLLDISY